MCRELLLLVLCVSVLRIWSLFRAIRGLIELVKIRFARFAIVGKSGTLSAIVMIIACTWNIYSLSIGGRDSRFLQCSSSFLVLQVLLEELGFYPEFMNVLRSDYLNPIATVLFPEWTGTSGLQSQRAFTVKYDFESMKENSDLSFHFDNAEVTLNISLDGDFDGGELYFGQMRTVSSLG